MMNIKNSFLIIAFLLGTSTIKSADWQESFENRQWEFVHYTFETKVNEKLIDALPLRCASLIPLFACALWPKKPAGMAIITVICCALPFLIDAIITEEITAQTYNDFVKEWPTNKCYTPQSLHTLFDKLYVLYTLYGFKSHQYHAKLTEVRSIIDQALSNHFPPLVRIERL